MLVVLIMIEKMLLSDKYQETLKNIEVYSLQDLVSHNKVIGRERQST